LNVRAMQFFKQTLLPFSICNHLSSPWSSDVTCNVIHRIACLLIFLVLLLNSCVTKLTLNGVWSWRWGTKLPRHFDRPRASQGYRSTDPVVTFFVSRSVESLVLY
jgi:hypothetical protein